MTNFSFEVEPPKPVQLVNFVFGVEPTKPVKFAGYTLYPARDRSRPTPKKLKTWGDWDKCLKAREAPDGGSWIGASGLMGSYPVSQTRVTPLKKCQRMRSGLPSKKTTFVPDPMLYTLQESSPEQREGMKSGPASFVPSKKLDWELSMKNSIAARSA